MNLTTAERSLVMALLTHFRLSLLKQLAAPNQLTDEGKARYLADIRLAEDIEAKLDSREAA